MDADYDTFEMVTAIRDFWLVNAESYQLSYCTNDGQTLSTGYYIVNWPEHIRTRRFEKHAEFHGLFELRKDAYMALKFMAKEGKQVMTITSEISSVPTAMKFILSEVKRAVATLRINYRRLR